MSDKTEKLGVGLTEQEKARFRVEAAKRGMSMSELAREILLDEVIGDDEEGTDQGNPTTSPTMATAD
jgi:plasmid stability protein